MKNRGPMGNDIERMKKDYPQDKRQDKRQVKSQGTEKEHQLAKDIMLSGLEDALEKLDREMSGFGLIVADVFKTLTMALLTLPDMNLKSEILDISVSNDEIHAKLRRPDDREDDDEDCDDDDEFLEFAEFAECDGDCENCIMFWLDDEDWDDFEEEEDYDGWEE